MSHQPSTSSRKANQKGQRTEQISNQGIVVYSIVTASGIGGSVPRPPTAVDVAADVAAEEGNVLSSDGHGCDEDDEVEGDEYLDKEADDVAGAGVLSFGGGAGSAANAARAHPPRLQISRRPRGGKKHR